MAPHRRTQRREVRSLAESARDQHEWTSRADAVDRGYRRTDVRALGVVDPANAVARDHGFATMRQSGIVLERRGHGADIEPDRVTQRECGKRVGDVVHAGKRHRIDGHDGLAAPHDARRTSASRDIPLRVRVLPRAESDRPASTVAKVYRQGIVEVGDRDRIAAEHAALRRDVVVEALVAVQVIGADVQHRRRDRTQCAGGLELEARQLQHVEIATAPEQRQRGRTQIPAGPDPRAGALRHGRDQRRDGALAVRSGDGDDRCIGCAGEQLDVADDRHTAPRRGPKRLLPHRHSRTDDDLRGSFEHRRIESAQTDLDIRELALDRGTPRRVLARIHRDDIPVRIREVTDARQPGLAETDHEHMAGQGRRAVRARRAGVDDLVRVHVPITGS